MCLLNRHLHTHTYYCCLVEFVILYIIYYTSYFLCNGYMVHLLINDKWHVYTLLGNSICVYVVNNPYLALLITFSILTL